VKKSLQGCTLQLTKDYLTGMKCRTLRNVMMSTSGLVDHEQITSLRSQKGVSLEEERFRSALSLSGGKYVLEPRRLVLSRNMYTVDQPW
jgi:hypothetical protein